MPISEQTFDQAVQVVQRQRGQFVVRQRAQKRRVRSVTVILSDGAGERPEVLLRVLALNQDDFLQLLQRPGLSRRAGQQIDQQRPRRREVLVQARDADSCLVVSRADGKISSELVPLLFQLLGGEPLRAGFVEQLSRGPEPVVAARPDFD